MMDNNDLSLMTHGELILVVAMTHIDDWQMMTSLKREQAQMLIISSGKHTSLLKLL